MRITAFKQSLAAAVLAMGVILDAGVARAATEGGNGDLTAEEQTAFDAELAKSVTLEAQIRREEQLLALQSSAAQPVILPGSPVGNAPGSVPAAVAEKPAPGIMMARLAISLSAAGMDQRAAAAHAEGVWGTDMGHIVANMEQSANTKGGFLVNTAYSSDFIDMLRSRVVIRGLGARSIPMPDGNLTMRRKTAGTTAGYIGERIPAPATDLTVGTLSMSAKTLAALVPITNRLIRRAAFGVEAIVRDDLLENVAVKEDQQFIRGVGSATAPAGLKSLIAGGNVLVMTAAPTLVTVTSDLGKLRLKVLNANVPMVSCGWILSPRVKLFLENLRDGNGNIAFPSVANGTLYGYPIGVTTSVPDNLGAGTNESEVYFGDFSQFLIGDTMSVTLASSDTAAYDDGGTIRAAFSNDETVIRLITEHDTQVRYDTAFAILTGVTWAP